MRPLVTALIALPLGVALVACGGGDPDRSADADPATTPLSETNPSETNPSGPNASETSPSGANASDTASGETEENQGKRDMPEPTIVDAVVTTTPHASSMCAGTFVRHDLDHTTTPRGDVTAMVDGTGTGVYLDDLDDDGAVDIVLPNLSGVTSIFWNTTLAGTPPTFERTDLDTGRFRQAAAADLDSDGDRDLILTTGIGPPIGFIQGDARSFERTEIRTRAVTFSIAPGDLDGNGSIELATGSYNAELTATRDNRVLTGVDVGVAILSPTAETLASGVETDFLTDSAQALATLIVDIDGDGLDDVVVGNDLGTPDRIWLGSADLPGVDGLTVKEFFDITSLSTMSIDVADIDNDGDRDLVTTDMARLPGEPDEVWATVEASIEQARVDEVQQPRNVLQVADGDPGDPTYAEQAVELGVDATGWSWAGLFGDLDDDGLADLYVVNGMRAEGLFDMLPDNELVEANQVFRNDVDVFTPMPEWELGATDGGRGMAQADVDGDGDLDIVVNNLEAPAALFENRLCDSDSDGTTGTAASSIIVEPIWSGAQNVDALGSSITISDGNGLVRSGIITGARGYISTSATQAHVGLGVVDPAQTFTATLRWPDGAVTIIDDVVPDTTVRVVRDSAALVATEESP